MRFPKQELNIDEYLANIKNLLSDNSCHIFIDTNIISQLYRLNKNVRLDFYNWVDSCEGRFHIPNWSVHEYSKHVRSENTKDYLSELSKAKTFSKELNNIIPFLEGYIDDSLLLGSSYEGKRAKMLQDIRSVTNTFTEIADSINKNRTSHEQNVHKEILAKLESYTLESNIYTIVENLSFGDGYNLRFDGKVPPGFNDVNKGSNRIGDLIIWKEILDYCKTNPLQGDTKIKAILVSRDLKSDMVYRPMIQKRNGHPAQSKEDKIEIAHESLVYEFKVETKSDNFYLISFYTLVNILSSQYNSLAISFQIATEQEHVSLTAEQDDNLVEEDLSATAETEPLEDETNNQNVSQETIDRQDQPITYTETALANSRYDASEESNPINECITQLKLYNWYRQNSAIKKLRSMTFNTWLIDQKNKDAFFVLGRSVLQSAEGTASHAMYFLDNLPARISSWPKIFQQAFIDGCLYEVFFDSQGEIRKKSFKTSYFSTVIQKTKQISLEKPFEFINKELTERNNGRFVPVVGGTQTYDFKFTISVTGGNDKCQTKTEALEINGIDAAETFKRDNDSVFSSMDNLKNALSEYYAIETDRIEISGVPAAVKEIPYIFDRSNPF